MTAADPAQTLTYLEITRRPTSPGPPAPAAKLALLRADKPSLRFYRFLDDAVGGKPRWPERRARDNDALTALLADARIEMYVLYADGQPAGFAVLDRRGDDIELARFGVLAEFGGRGLNDHFLRWTIDQAWTHEPERLWVRVSSADDRQLLALYQRHGFTVYRQDKESGAGNDA